MPNHKGRISGYLITGWTDWFGCKLFLNCKNYMQNYANMTFGILPLIYDAHLKCLFCLTMCVSIKRYNLSGKIVNELI
jgi:hypothetical protein